MGNTDTKEAVHDHRIGHAHSAGEKEPERSPGKQCGQNPRHAHSAGKQEPQGGAGEGGCGGHAHSHRHVHSAQEKKAVLNRLSRAVGHLESVMRMIERDEDCSDVLVQLAAVRGAINNTGKVIMKNHISQCIVEAIEEKDFEAVEALNHAIDCFIK